MKARQTIRAFALASAAWSGLAALPALAQGTVRQRPMIGCLANSEVLQCASFRYYTGVQI